VPYWKLHEVSTLFSIPPKLLALTPVGSDHSPQGHQGLEETLARRPVVDVVQVAKVVIRRHEREVYVDPSLQHRPTHAVMLVEPLRKRPVLEPRLDVPPPQLGRDALHGRPLVPPPVSVVVDKEFRPGVVDRDVLGRAQVAEVGIAGARIRHRGGFAN